MGSTKDWKRIHSGSQSGVLQAPSGVNCFYDSTKTQFAFTAIMLIHWLQDKWPKQTECRSRLEEPASPIKPDIKEIGKNSAMPFSQWILVISHKNMIYDNM